MTIADIVFWWAVLNFLGLFILLVLVILEEVEALSFAASMALIMASCLLCEVSMGCVRKQQWEAEQARWQELEKRMMDEMQKRQLDELLKRAEAQLSR